MRIDGEPAARWLRELQHAASGQGSLRGLSQLVKVVGMAAGCAGAVLWQETDRITGEPELAVLAQWPRTGAGGRRPRCDGTTLAAYDTGSLALPARAEWGSGNGDGTRVTGALPVRFLDGGRGVLSLVGDAELSAAAFDVAADLLDVLPELCATLHDRQALRLVRECQRVLHEVDAGPGGVPPPERVATHLTGLCRSIGALLECAEVSLYAREHAGQDTVPLLATSLRQHPPEVTVALPETAADLPAPAARGGVLDCPLVSGGQVWGLLRCAGAYGPPLWFTGPDEESMTLVAGQLAQFWSGWLQRRAISAENRSWHRLAAGITRFNQLISQELSSGTPREGAIDDLALRTVLDVAPECTRADIWHRPRRASPGSARLGLRAARTGAGELDAADAVLPPEVADALGRVWRTGTAVLAPVGADGWVVGTPIGFGGRCEGVLAAYGPAGALPGNLPQVGEIIGDQLALYQRLQSTMGNLQETRRRLQETVRAQADTLADLEHQLVSPLLTATSRIERVIQGGRSDGRTDAQLRAARGLCRKASRVAMSAGVFAGLSKDRMPSPREDLLSADEVLRVLIACADDAQLLSNPRRRIAFDVRRESVRLLGRRLIRGDRSFLEQCVGNVLDNAAKYSYVDTAVDIAGAVRGDSFAVVVTSRGLPLGPDDVHDCLLRNWRGAQASASTGEGSGLGLWIVDNLMRSMRGSVEVSAADDETTVRLNLPIG
jgi:signal transduction histidine kinase